MKSVLFAIAKMSGGGAEKVLSLLAHSFHQSMEVSFWITNASETQIIRPKVLEKITQHCLAEELLPATWVEKGYYALLSIYARGMCKAYEICKRAIPAHLSYASFVWQYYKEIKIMRQAMIAHPDTAVIAFLQPTIPIVLLAARGLPNRIIISERGNPNRWMKGRYGTAFVKKYYTRADQIVFQTANAMQAYPKFLQEKSTIIFNPLSGSLPIPHTGTRQKIISTFCRISKQKNLFLLVEGFALMHQKYPDYQLEIIGNPFNEEDEKIYSDLVAHIQALGLSSSVMLLPFSSTVLCDVVSHAMYVNSSDYEGISNSMLEAMAIGLPTICTDCPVGGAKAMIQHGENGLLVPMNDPLALCKGMCDIIENSALAEKLSQNGVKLREMLSIEKVSAQWKTLLECDDTCLSPKRNDG